MPSIHNMVTNFILVVLLSCILCSLVGAKHFQFNEENVDHAFHSYINRYSKNYANVSEHEMRKAIFLENWKMIAHHNRQNLSYTMALNKFADRNPEELAYGGSLPEPADLQGFEPFPYTPDEVRTLAKTLPKNFDMRREKYLSPVKDQGSCGACWAFAAVGAVEGAVMRKRGGRVDLSEQALVDCVPADGNPPTKGCKGNFKTNAFEYMKTHGVLFEEEYPYEAEDETCHDKFMVKTTKIGGYSRPTPNDPEALKVALYYHGPVAVSVHLSPNMMFYKKGIFVDPECNSSSKNHAMLVVGYGTRDIDSVNYWIVKNSHGTGWGVNGYALISAKDDNCFVLTDPAYPII